MVTLRGMAKHWFSIVFNRQQKSDLTRIKKGCQSFFVSLFFFKNSKFMTIWQEINVTLYEEL